MPELNIKDAEKERFTEPLLPIEKKLIGWSLGIGVVSLIALSLINRFVPI